MTNYKPSLYAFLFIAAIAAGAWLNHSCNRKPEPQPVSPADKSEADLQRIVVTDTTDRARFRKLAAERLTQIEAIQGTLATETRKRKEAEQKTAESAAEYARNPTLHNCHKALVDCQHENETKSSLIAVQERMIAEKDSLGKLYVSEIDRQVGVIDTLAEGWRKANAGWKAEETAHAKERNKLRVYGTAAFEQHPINNNIKLGGTVTHKRVLIGYQKGMLQNTHEIKAGFLLW